MTDIHAPNYDLLVNGATLPLTVKRMVQSVEYESTDGMADLLRVQLESPYGSDGMSVLIGSKLFLPGNELAMYAGYGSQLGHVGSAVIRKVHAQFPQEGVPGLEVIAYTRDVIMNDNAPEPPKDKQQEDTEESKSKRKGKGKAKKAKKDNKTGRIFKDTTYADAIELRAEDYGFDTDVDPTPDPVHDFMQKAGLSDFQFIQGLANITGYYFWVDCDSEGIWTLHFKDPATLKPADIQDKQYTFKYNSGDYSTLLSFDPEISLQGQAVKLKAVAKNPYTGGIFEVTIEDKESPDEPTILVEPVGEGNKPGSASQIQLENEKIESELTSAASVKLYIDDFSFSISADKSFRDEKELAFWALQWFRRYREQFIQGSGTIIGIDTLRARQTHRFTGLAKMLDGEYQFTRVRHQVGLGGYLCEFSARRIIGQALPEADTKVLPPSAGNF